VAGRSFYTVVGLERPERAGKRNRTEPLRLDFDRTDFAAQVGPLASSSRREIIIADSEGGRTPWSVPCSSCS
jgi:hypothetical protein